MGQLDLRLANYDIIARQALHLVKCYQVIWIHGV